MKKFVILVSILLLFFVGQLPALAQNVESTPDSVQSEPPEVSSTPLRLLSTKVSEATELSSAGLSGLQQASSDKKVIYKFW